MNLRIPSPVRPAALGAALAALVVVVPATFAHSGGSGGRGGGSLLRLDGKWDLLEIQRMRGRSGKPYRLSAEAVEALRAIRRLFEEYSGLRSPRYWREVLGDLADIRLVRRLPCSPPPSEGLVPYGCTENGITYLDEARFATLEPKRKLLAVLHERGHAYDPSADGHEWIHPFIQALTVLVDLKLEQQRGEFRRLEPSEIRALLGTYESETLRAALAPDSAPIAVPFVVPRGGGLVWTPAGLEDRLDIDAESVVSVDSRIDFRDCAVDRSARDFLAVRGAPRVRGSSVVGSLVECLALERTRIRDSSVRYRTTTEAPTEYARIEDTEIRGSRFDFRTRSFAMSRRSVVSESWMDCGWQDPNWALVLLDFPAVRFDGTVHRGMRREGGVALPMDAAGIAWGLPIDQWRSGTLRRNTLWR